MNPAHSQEPRRLVPRWRSLSKTLQSRELGSPIKRSHGKAYQQIYSSDMLSRLERWRLTPSLVTAAELVEACIVEGRELDAVNAARRLVAIDRDAAPLIRDQAARLLERTGFADDVPQSLTPVASNARIARHITRVHPHDALAWVELALQQTISGSTSAAERSIVVALSLAPDNRHVLRSAARLFLHCSDPERALATVRRSASVRNDPWLIASEIALASVADKHSRFLKAGDRMLLTGDFDPRQVTELAGAVATEELSSGNRKKSKRWFTNSMIDPTGSALAQGEWATSALGSDLITEARISQTFENAEALAFHLFRFRRLHEVSEACRQWAENDPFSVRPFEFGAVTAGYIEDFEVALDFAEHGLKIRPSSATLLNAAAFAAASLNRVDEAEAAISKIRLSEANRPQQLIALANRGLIAFRKHDEARGRRLYAEAIDSFKRDGAHEFAARAKIYLAREAFVARASDWQSLLVEAKAAMDKYSDSGGMISLKILERAASQSIMSNGSHSALRSKAAYPVKKPNVSVKVSFSQLSFNFDNPPERA